MANTRVMLATHPSTHSSVSGSCCWATAFLFGKAGGRRGRNIGTELCCICNCMNSGGTRGIGVPGRRGLWACGENDQLGSEGHVVVTAG